MAPLKKRELAKRVAIMEAMRAKTFVVVVAVRPARRRGTGRRKARLEGKGGACS